MKRRILKAIPFAAVLLAGTAMFANETTRLSCTQRCERRYQNGRAEARAQLNACLAPRNATHLCHSAYAEQLYSLEAEREACRDDCQVN
ncbi:MAG: hypothetical protein JNL98_41380 [Bryobacterales bacterium]|nr:hypothetical protein [Bryobacterales bacterium]